MIEQIGAFAGLASFLGLGILALLSFTQGRDIRRLREWAGSAPERDVERKETTSTIAAQRAEELRQLEEARTAEHEAVSKREERRRRREEGLPELTRRERLREGFCRLRRTAGGTALAGRDLRRPGPDRRRGRLHPGQRLRRRWRQEGQEAGGGAVKPGEIEVAVLNGTSTAGLAATFGDKVENKGFELGAVSNTEQPFETSVVMFERGHEPEATKVGKQLRDHEDAS